MIGIEISAAAYAALARALPADRLQDAQRSPRGGFYLWLDPFLAEKLSAVRGRSEGYSEAILRMAEQEAP